MLIIRTAEALTSALDSHIDHHLKRLLALRCDQLSEHGTLDPIDAALILVAEPHDQLSHIEEALGLPIATSIMDGLPHSSPDFQPNWEWCHDHNGHCWEALFLLTDDGPADVLFVINQPGLDPVLHSLCRRFADPAVPQVLSAITD